MMQQAAFVELESMNGNVGNVSHHLGVMESCMPLDTIEEAREGSSLSGESDEHLDTICEEECFPPKPLDPPAVTTSAVTLAVKEPEDKKIKVQWMSDEDDDDDNDDGNPDNDGRVSSTDVYEVTDPNIDKGWAWVVLFANFSLFTISSGLLASAGLYYVQMLKEFKQSRSYTAWMGSLMNAFFMLAGPLCSIVIRKTSCRTSIIIGSLLMTLGFMMSSMAKSLPFIFFSYGIVVATGMNFVYSGQIISLAQYFQRRHSLATSASMVGIGVGVFFMIRFLDYIIMEYGWRGSFIFCAGISLHICIFGSLIFPFKNMESEPENTVNEFKQTFSQVSMAPSLSQAGHSTVINRKYVLNRSVSSLKLSIGAGYLSSSISNLDMDCKSVYGTVSSNQHSFCSRGSQYFSGIRSNHHSFSQFHYGEYPSYPSGLLSLIRPNQNSFCSRGSSYGIHSLRSNSQSFSNKNSQMDLHHFLYNHPLPSLKDVDKDDIDRLSSILENNTEQENLPSKCTLIMKKIKIALQGTARDLVEGKLVDPCLLLINITMFFTMLATMKLFVIYKDLSKFLGVEDYYSIAMSTVGIGDILGRISAGFLSSYKCIDSVLAYAIAMILCGIAIAFHICATWGPMFPLLTGLFGFFYGQQNVFITIVPAILFGRENLVSVFGYILFFAGLGALVGTPLAGYIVDCTGSYMGVVSLSFSCCVIGGLCTIVCCIIHRRKQKISQRTISV